MKRLLLPLLAALAIPTAASAESYWLVIYKTHCGVSGQNPCGVAMEKIEMKSLKQCEENGQDWISPATGKAIAYLDYMDKELRYIPNDDMKDVRRGGRRGERTSYKCLTGK
tara:strand:+ start:58431 stop:58763 length:333 start_codon:yes stop_codon:yes gene_type:complete